MAEEETSRFISPCACKGTLMFVHEECLKLWILQKNGIEEVFKYKVIYYLNINRLNVNYVLIDLE